ncbi:MFS transporter [Gryllotalpicola reticulitermitis]|uniref:MFS transporter n=1 Tax=Gryllotalpicola reticulitermitis TaxID=1184153 RepID=A0ABV8Q7D9_9MICO
MSARPRWRDMFASLKVPNYRLYATGQIVSTTAQGMQRIAQDWIVLQLSGNVADVGITVALQFAPMLVFGLYGGVIADRYPKRRILQLTQSVMALLAATMAVLIITGAIHVWMIWCIALVGGFATLVDNPARQSFVSEVVGPTLLRNALSLNSSTFQLGALIGPALGGVLLSAIGGGWSFGVNAIACLGTVFALSRMDGSKLLPAPPAPRHKGQLREGLAYAARKDEILFTLIVLTSVALFIYTMPVLLTAFADHVYRVGSTGYGIFNALVALGALSGALLSTRRVSISLRTVIGGAIALGIVQALAGLAPQLAVFGVLLVGAGLAQLLYFIASNSLVQMSTNIAIRGRVMGVFVLIQLGGQSIGGPVMGSIVDAYGPHVGMTISGAVPLATALVAGLVLIKRRGQTVSSVVRGALHPRRV